MIDNLTIAKEVQRAINKGAHTLKAIRRKTGRTPDQVGDALAYLTFTARAIRSEIRGETRVYLPVPKRRGPIGDALSFSVLRGLMPRARSINQI